MATYGEAFQCPQPQFGASPSSRRPIDLVHLARHTMGDKDTEAHVLHMFARQARQCVNQLCGGNHLVASRDRLAVIRTLRGSASSVGAFGLCQLAERLEDNLDDGMLHDALSDAVLDVENFISGLSR